MTLGVLLPVLAFAMLALAAPAHALYGPLGGGSGAEIVSVDNASDEQANAATTDVAISADGEYVVFQTEATNLFEDDGETAAEQQADEPPGTLREGGIFRYDRLTGQLQIVASGSLVDIEGPEKGKVRFRGAKNPSVSADGRYVVFTSAQPLVPQVAAQDAKEGHYNIDVYERDMDKAPGEAGAYILVSALNHSEQPPEYEDASIKPVPGGDPGTQLWPNTAVSANGRFVLFRTAEVPSSLPDETSPTMPPNQLFVRDVQEKTTTLVTETMIGKPAGGAAGPATLSADGSTIAWVGENAPAQTVFLPGEPQSVESEETTPYYLWRRWQEPDPKTRRITGIADPEDPACAPGEGVTENPTAEGPCYGPLSFQESSLDSISAATPGLSANGYTVAFLAGSVLRPDETKPDALDVFLTSMAAGLTRKESTSELTLAVKNVQGDGTASVTSLALSADGSHIAFVSQRNVFPLSEPELLGSLSTTAQQRELYVIDLHTDTLERAVLGLDESEPNGSVEANPTLTEDGSTVAFVSTASNLLVGDANGVADAFTASYEPPAGTAAATATGTTNKQGFSLSSESAPELKVEVKHGRRPGEDVLTVTSPGAGALSVQASGNIPLARRGRKGDKGAKADRKHVRLAHAKASVRNAGATTLVLRLAPEYRSALARAHELKAVAAIVFRPSVGGEVLSSEVQLTFDEAHHAAKSQSPRRKTKLAKAR